QKRIVHCMNFKHLALLGAAALVVFGCVLAAGCTSTEQTQAVTPLSSAAGEWYCPECTDGNGNTVTAIQTIKADGTGYWMQLADDKRGFRIERIYTSEFTAPDQNGAFDKVSSTGMTHKMVYDAAKDTITQDGKNVYTRLDPLAGIWYGASVIDNDGKTTTLFKPDGTGGLIVSNADKGTAEVLTLTWKKNADGTYAVKYSNGIERTYTVDDSGLTASLNTGSMRTKAFTDSTYLMSVTGAWYNKDNDRSAVFNADGTGFLVSKSGIAPFTWRLKEIGKFEITYTGGTWDDGTIAKGKVTEWTYDRENDVFTSTSDGSNYIHPAETVEGKITLS
ncbi:MAG TPA: hypothetical protein O0X97_06225, partial [Methanocorpusculum sp.]|nr:hypothetical protein [Methanocorpusculum sp.]